MKQDDVQPSIEARIQLASGDFRLQVDLAPARGWTVLLGPSGSGKTTLLDCLAGLRTPQTGYIRLGTQVVLDSARRLCLPPRLRGVGLVSQYGDLFEHLDVEANLRFGERRPAASGRADLKFSFDQVVERLEIEGLLHQRPGTLSGGERQRVALGRALLSTPQVLLLDEPLSAVDSALRNRLLQVLLRIKRDLDLPCLYVTHHLQEAITLADEVVVLEHGRIVERDTPFALAGSPPRVQPLRDLGGRVDNLLVALVREANPEEGTVTLHVGKEGCLTLPWQADLSPDVEVRLSVRAEDVLIARGSPEVSARNQLTGKIVEMVQADQGVLVRSQCADSGLSLWSCLTPAGVSSLHLTLGCEVLLLIKSQAIEVHPHA